MYNHNKQIGHMVLKVVKIFQNCHKVSAVTLTSSSKAGEVSIVKLGSLICCCQHLMTSFFGQNLAVSFRIYP